MFSSFKPDSVITICSSEELARQMISEARGKFQRMTASSHLSLVESMRARMERAESLPSGSGRMAPAIDPTLVEIEPAVEREPRVQPHRNRKLRHKSKSAVHEKEQ
jgi:hypothetical protein